MPGPGSGGNALFGTDGKGPNVRSGCGAGAQGGPEDAGAALGAVLAGFGAGAMTGRNGSAGAGCISPRLLPPCQPPAAAQDGPDGPAGPGWDRLGPMTGPGTGSGLRCSCCPRRGRPEARARQSAVS